MSELHPHPPRETRAGYLRRVLPDITAIEVDVRDALLEEDHGCTSDFHVGAAVGKAQKLLEDLQRAARAK